ncbi:hypothetical protein JCM30760_10810 [Thiomicrorhabdus hydrogeniphila]
MNFLSSRYFYSRKIKWLFILVASLFISACSESEEKKCIDKQSHLWDSKTNDKNANKAYWKAVEKCKKANN